ncbi:MAG: sulfatase [Planctomycetota bacterium]
MRRNRIPAALALMGMLFWTGCGDRSPPAGPGVIRLVDQAEAAQFESFVDLTQERLQAGIPADEVFREGFDQPEPDRYVLLPGNMMARFQSGQVLERRINPVPAQFAGAGKERALELGQRETLLLSVPVDADETYEVELFLKGAGVEFVTGAVLELDRLLSPAELTEPALIAAAFGGTGGRKVSLRSGRTQAEDKSTRFSVSLHTFEGTTRALLVAVGSGDLGLVVDDLAVTRPSPFLEQLLLRSAEFRHPYVRRPAVGRDFRESIVLVAPGRARFRLRLPEERPRFSCAVGAPDHGRIQGCRITVRATGGGRSLEARHDLVAQADPRWNPLELDLTGLAGQEVVLELVAEPLDPAGAGDGIAFGAPVIMSEEDGGAARPLDVILISLDTMRADRMSLYGAKVPTTPFLKEMEESSLVFDVAIAPAAYTLPSHASMLTGQLPDRIAPDRPIRGLHPLASPLLAKDFRAAGYRTLAFTGGGYVHPVFGFDGGFERFATLDLGMALRVGDEAQPQMAAALEELTEMLRKDDARPRFLFLHTFAPHQYRSPAEDLLAVGADPEEVPLLSRLHREYRPVPELLAEMGGTGPENSRRLKLLYDGAQRVADAFVRHVVTALRQAGRLDRTLIFIVSDHGEELYEHGGFGHAHQIFEELIHVPFLVSGPGIKPGRNRDVVSLVDLAPTLRDLCGLSAPVARMDGRSLVPLLRGDSMEKLAAIATVYPTRDLLVRAYRGQRHKLLVVGQEQPRLFDLEADPAETIDFSAQDRGLSERLRGLLNARVEAMESEGTGIDPDLPPDLLRELEKLGYVSAKDPKGRK